MTARLQSLLVVGCLLVAALYAPENLALLHPAAHPTGFPAQPASASAKPTDASARPTDASAEPTGSWAHRPGPSARPPAVLAVAAESRPAVGRRPAVVLAGWRRADEVRIASRPAPPQEELAGE